MTKITPEIIDDLILDQTFADTLDGKPPVFTLLVFATLAEYQRALEDQIAAGAAPAAASEPEPESETDSEPGLCPVAEQVATLTEQVATLTEKLDFALHHSADMDELVEVHQDILEWLSNIVEMHTGMFTTIASRAVSPEAGTLKDMLPLLSDITSGLLKATK